MEIIDRIITGDIETIKKIKNSIIEEDLGILVATIKVKKFKSRVSEKGVKSHDYIFIGNIRTYFEDEVIWKEIFKFTVRKANIIHIILRGIIILLMILNRSCKINLIVKPKIEKLIMEFLMNSNERKRMDNILLY